MKLIFSEINHPDLTTQTVDRPPAVITLFRRSHIQYLIVRKAVITVPADFKAIFYFFVANSMISNFHMPLSTLLMIVAAFGGYEQVMDAYHVALKEGYRFGTYGDAMLILDK